MSYKKKVRKTLLILAQVDFNDSQKNLTSQSQNIDLEGATIPRAQNTHDLWKRSHSETQHDNT